MVGVGGREAEVHTALRVSASAGPYRSGAAGVCPSSRHPAPDAASATAAPSAVHATQSSTFTANKRTIVTHQIWHVYRFRNRGSSLTYPALLCARGVVVSYSWRWEVCADEGKADIMVAEAQAYQPLSITP